MNTPRTFAAIDAGSNALRAVVAATAGPGELRILHSERVPVRLGRGAFTRGEFDGRTIDEAAATFARFRSLFEQHRVSRFRAVTTSATRSAHNREILLHRIYHESGIDLEIIDGEEEARLVRRAMLHSFRDRLAPYLIIDLGGGSLEVNVRDADDWRAASLPVGTVRLAETFGLYGAITEEEAKMVRRYASTLLATVAPLSRAVALTPAAASGGNAEAWAKLFGKSDERGVPALEFADLEELLPRFLAAGVAERVERYKIGHDRAEVMGVAGLVLATVGQKLSLRRLLVPGVGIREGLLLDLAEDVAPGASRDQLLLAEARTFAARVGHDLTHGEHVRRLARALFDQLGRQHGLPEELAVVLEVAALLHDVGEVVHRRGHHKHGEYMIRWGRIPGLDSPLREMVALLVRTHRKSLPDLKKHDLYANLPRARRGELRKLLALLRLADALDTDHRERITRLRVSPGPQRVDIALEVAGTPADFTTFALRKCDLFRSEFGCDVTCSTSARSGEETWRST
jgi:exopolyphosphatase/guanosine-5'-triphosphate,3'-diphosphate pyrophosphatase